MVDFNKWKVSDLKAELKKRGLPQNGIKSILIARLEEAESEATAQNESSGSDDGTSTVESPKAVPVVELPALTIDALSPQPVKDLIQEPRETVTQATETTISITTIEETHLPQHEIASSNGETMAQVEEITDSTTTNGGSNSPQRKISASEGEICEDRQKRKRRSQSPSLSTPETSQKRLRTIDKNSPENENVNWDPKLADVSDETKDRSESKSEHKDMTEPEYNTVKERMKAESTGDMDAEVQPNIEMEIDSPPKQDGVLSEPESNLEEETIVAGSKEVGAVNVEPPCEMEIGLPNKQDSIAQSDEQNPEREVAEAKCEEIESVGIEPHIEMEIDPPHKQDITSEPKIHSEKITVETYPKGEEAANEEPLSKTEIEAPHNQEDISESESNPDKRITEVGSKEGEAIDVKIHSETKIEPESHSEEIITEAEPKGEEVVNAEPHSEVEIDALHKQDCNSSPEQVGTPTHSRRDSRFKGLFNGGDNSDIAYDQPELERAVSPAIHPATTALYIRDMQRPLNPQHLRTHLSALAVPPGQSPNPDLISTFYLDPIRTHAFVSFSSIYAASRVRTALHSRIWPEERNRKPLWVDFVPEDRLEEWITQEQESNTGGRATVRKWEVCYDVDDHRQVKASLQEATNAPLPAQINPSSTNSQVSSNQIPLGPRTNIDGAPSGPRSHLPMVQSSFVEIAGSKLNELFNFTTTKPVLYWKPVSKELANKRLDCLEDSYSAEVKAGGRVMGDPHRYTFEEGDLLVDRGVELVPGLRPPPGYRAPRPGGDRGGYSGGIGGRGRGSSSRFRGRGGAGGAGAYRGSYSDKYSYGHDSRSSRDYHSRY
ncbi:hypothetical protein K3495_g2577 [Podosphaera aphanis]|nr:hypothetical protein K3495_g2577 [Podosphaera aphanis]